MNGLLIQNKYYNVVNEGHKMLCWSIKTSFTSLDNSFLSHRDKKITFAELYYLTRKWNVILINLWKRVMQHMISNYDIKARKLSIDNQRQWCNIYTLLRTGILFSCLPSFYFYLTTGKWKILPLIDKILCNGIWTKKSWRGNNQLFYLYPSFFERYCVKRKYLYWPLNDRIKRMIWSERMAHSTLKNNEKHVYFHVGFQHKSIKTNFISITYLLCDMKSSTVTKGTRVTNKPLISVIEF